MTIRAIETEYAGHRFRSRLEARWAVLFDRLEIEWEYEPQGYEVGLSRRHYLPDFHLVKSDIWVEVKGRGESVDWGLMADCVDYGIGLPGDPTTLAVVGPIPERPIHSYRCVRSRSQISRNFMSPVPPEWSCRAMVPSKDRGCGSVKSTITTPLSREM